MPNFCANELTVKGPQNEIEDFMMKIRDTSTGEVYFPTLMPISNDDNVEDMYGTNRVGAMESCFLDNGVTFDTAWAAPIPFFEHVSTLYPNIEFELIYSEPNDDYCGIAIFKDGKCLREEEDEYISGLARELFGDEYVDDLIEEYGDEWDDEE